MAKECILLVFLLSLMIPVPTQWSPKVCLYFFYGVGCSACARVEPYISQLEQKYAQLEVHRFEIYGNRSNLLLLNRYFNKHGFPQDQRTIPALLYYNLLFILPQILITLLVYLGSSSIPKITHWKRKSTKLLHLAIGLAIST